MFMCIRFFKKMVKMEFLNMKYICNYMQFEVLMGEDNIVYNVLLISKCIFIREMSDYIFDFGL